MRQRIANAVWRFIMGFPNAKVSAIDALDLTKRDPDDGSFIHDQSNNLGSYSLEESRQIFNDPTARERIDAAKDYSVTSAPRHIPWHIRKREREAAARTKRRQLESFRDIEEGN